MDILLHYPNELSMEFAAIRLSELFCGKKYTAKSHLNNVRMCTHCGDGLGLSVAHLFRNRGYCHSSHMFSTESVFSF